MAHLVCPAESMVRKPDAAMKPAMLAWVRIHDCQENEQKYRVSLAKARTDEENAIITKLCDASAGTLVDTIRDYYILSHKLFFFLPRGSFRGSFRNPSAKSFRGILS